MPIEPLRAATLSTVHGFFTRQGGISTGPYASLNCSLSSGDARDAVLENRARAARAIGADPESVVGLMQVHGTDVVGVRTPWIAGGGPKADAMVTNRPGLTLGIITADCAPVLLADPDAAVIGAVHAGWRGALGGVLEAALAAMAALGATSITAGIGPCIRQESYEVGTDLRDAVIARARDDDRFFTPGQREGRWQFDLAGYCAARLAAVGVASVETSAADTLADEARFFSHRRRMLNGAGPTGHQISLIRLA
jgi:YfiH family protein